MTCIGGDKTCGGLVEEAWVVLHDSAEDCCAHEYSWMSNELCAARSTHSTLSKFWADKTNAKCQDDLVVPTEDLSMALYESIEDCCLYGLSWLSKGACFSSSGSGMDLTGLGSNKYYIDYVKEQCAQDCDGPAPCGGLAQQWNILYETAEQCCDRISWVSRSDCLKD